MLESVLKAYLKNSFEEAGVVFPIQMKTVKQYMKTLVCLYEVSTGFQKSNSSIADVIPSIENEIIVLENIDLPVVYKAFAQILVRCLRHKFEYELNSNIYKVCDQ